MAKSKQEIRDLAANLLGILELNQSLQSQDSARIEHSYDEVYAILKEKGLATWASTAEVPNELTRYVYYLVALFCADTYAVSNDRYNRIVAVTGADGDEAYRMIAELITPHFKSQSQPKDY